jgi:hypothetical protein
MKTCYQNAVLKKSNTEMTKLFSIIELQFNINDINFYCKKIIENFEKYFLYLYFTYQLKFQWNLGKKYWKIAIYIQKF